MTTFRRMLCSLLALLILVSMPLTALAAEFDLYLGDVNITADENGQTTHQPDTGNSYTGFDVTITTSAPTDNTITITTNGGDASVTLKDVTIDATGTGEAAITTDRGADTTVTIELDGTNTLQGDRSEAGIETNGDGQLVIQDNSGEAGFLEANGGDAGGAGIGGSYHEDGTDITITGGTIVANGGHHSAGIGGGLLGDGTNITITGGTVIATGGKNTYSGDGKDGAGIGGGRSGDGSNITITGGNVTAISSGSGAGIGGGDYANGSNILISGGTVHAESNEYGAGIGGGGIGTGSDITICGDPTVTADGRFDIGSGFYPPVNYDNSGLYTTGSINGVYGTVIPPEPDLPDSPAPEQTYADEPILSVYTYDYDYFWRQVEAKIRQTPRGQSLTIDAGGFASMPSYVMDAIAETGVTLNVQWYGGNDVVIDHAYSGSALYYHFYFSALPQLLAD